MRLCVGLSIFRKIRVMCPSHFNPDRCSLNVPEHILATITWQTSPPAVQIFSVIHSIILLSQTGSFKI